MMVASGLAPSIHAFKIGDVDWTTCSDKRNCVKGTKLLFIILFMAWMMLCYQGLRGGAHVPFSLIVLSFQSVWISHIYTKLCTCF